MGKGKNEKFKKKGYQNTQSSSRIIEKRSGKGNMHNATRDLAPPCANVPTFPNAPLSTVGCNWDAAQGEGIHRADQMSGYIFMCNRQTKTDCYKYRVFGIPSARMEVVAKIKPHMKLFLFDFDLKLLYGVYIAASSGILALEPTAFGGKFSAQVRFEIFSDCLPLPEGAFKQVLKDNYTSGTKFRQELSNKQVADLVSLFCPIAEPPVTAFSLMQKAVPPAKIVLPNVEVQIRPADELSASYDQYLARQQLTHAGAPHDSQHVLRASPPFPHIPHSLAANMTGLQPAALFSQPQCDQFFPAEAHQAYFPQTPSSGCRYATGPVDSKMGMVPRSDTTNNYYNHIHNLAIAASNPPSQAQSILQLQFQAPPYGPAHLPSSSYTAAYWAGVAAEDPTQVNYGQDQSYTAVPENCEKGTLSQLDAVHAYQHQNTTNSTANLPMQAPSQVSSEAAAYWPLAAYNGRSTVYFGPVLRP